LFLTLIESRFDPQAESSKGALGMTQVMPKVWLKRIDFISDRKDLMDPFLNIHAGAHVLRHYLDRAKGNVKLALLMYNRGEGAVNRDILKGHDPSNGYAHKVLFSNENERRLKSSRTKDDDDGQAG
jgi:soluble lytic murein transglycosylase-like protein